MKILLGSRNSDGNTRIGPCVLPPVVAALKYLLPNVWRKRPVSSKRHIVPGWKSLVRNPASVINNPALPGMDVKHI